MKREAWKWTIFGGVLAFFLIYGIEMASSGIQHIYGPLGPSYTSGQVTFSPEHYDQQQQQQRQQRYVPMHSDAQSYNPGITNGSSGLDDSSNLGGQGSTGSLGEPGDPVGQQPGVYTPIRSGAEDGFTSRPTVNRAAEQTAGMLQSVSSSGIRLVVSLFEAVTN